MRGSGREDSCGRFEELRYRHLQPAGQCLLQPWLWDPEAGGLGGAPWKEEALLTVSGEEATIRRGHDHLASGILGLHRIFEPECLDVSDTKDFITLWPEKDLRLRKAHLPPPRPYARNDCHVGQQVGPCWGQEIRARSSYCPAGDLGKSYTSLHSRITLLVPFYFFSFLLFMVVSALRCPTGPLTCRAQPWAPRHCPEDQYWPGMQALLPSARSSPQSCLVPSKALIIRAHTRFMKENLREENPRPISWSTRYHIQFNSTKNKTKEKNESISTVSVVFYNRLYFLRFDILEPC